MSKSIQIFLLFSIALNFYSSAQDSTVQDSNYVKFYYENGNISSEGILENGVPQGEWKAYFENGNLKSIGSRENGTVEGKWIFYRENGNKEKEINYQNGKKNGLEKVFNADGILTHQFNYVDEVKEGEATDFYVSGEVSKISNFTEGKEQGKAIEYGTDGRIITFLSYSSGFLRTREPVNRYSNKGLKSGRWIEYFPNKKTIKEEGNYSNGKRHGMFKIYNRRGDLQRIENYRNGELQENTSNDILNVKKELGQDGKVKSIGSYANGKKQGIFREYDSEGNITSSAVYENDIKTAEGIIDGSGNYNGSWKHYYPTGELRAEGEYENSEKTGKWIFYFISGEVEQKGNYKKDLAAGEWVWYHKNGEVKRREYYRKGREDGESEEYEEKGKLINSGVYSDGLRTGAWFLTIGDYEEKGEFIDDEKNGNWKSFYKNTESVYFEGEYAIGIPIKKHIYYFKNGTKKAEGKFQGGERHGDWKFYNPDGTIRLIIRYNNGKEVRLNGEKI